MFQLLLLFLLFTSQAHAQVLTWRNPDPDTCLTATEDSCPTEVWVERSLDGGQTYPEKTVLPAGTIKWTDVLAQVGDLIWWKVSEANAAGSAAAEPICATIASGLTPTIVQLESTDSTLLFSGSLPPLSWQLQIDGVNVGDPATDASAVQYDPASLSPGDHRFNFMVCDSALRCVSTPSVVVTIQGTTLVASLLYHFDEAAGAVATDSSGNGRDGAISGATWATAGKGGSALTFGGGAAKVVSPLTSTATSHTIMLWAYRTGPGGNGYGRMFDKRTTGPEVELLYNDDAAGKYRYIRGSGQWVIPQPSAGVWHHIAVVFDASTGLASIYVDGVAAVVTQQSAASSYSDNADPYVIGNRGAGDRGWSGMLDEVRVYDRALKPEEIQSVMNGQ